MAEAERVSARWTRKKQREGAPMLLVCAYEDEEKCRSLGVDGSITHSELEGRRPFLSKDQLIVFF